MNGKMAILMRFAGPDEEVAVDVAEDRMAAAVSNGKLVHVRVPNFTLSGNFKLQVHTKNVLKIEFTNKNAIK